MKTNQLHVLVSPTPEGSWLAHVLDFDQAAQADSAEKAIELVPELVETVRTHLEKVGQPAAIWSRAPEDDWKRFSRARKGEEAVKLTHPVPKPGGEGQVEECLIGRLEEVS